MSEQLTSPSGSIGTEAYTYSNGHLSEIKIGSTSVWKLNGENALGILQLTKNGSNRLQRYYIGGCYEFEQGVSSIKEMLYLGGDAYSAPAVYVTTGSSWVLYYICRDHLGSITHLVNSSGTVVYEYSYDAWGRLRNPADQAAYPAGSELELFLGRGYTGHEHLPMFGLINMNARLYDPAIGRFLSPDPYVQSPDFSQNFNRYSYCLNNPLIYTDPSGEKWWHWALGGLALIDPVSAITTGLAVSGTASVSALTTASVAVGTATGLSANLYTTYYPFSNEFYEIQKVFSPIAFKPNFSFSSIQNGKGFDASVGFSKFARFHYGASYYTSSYGGYSGWETRIGGEIALAPNINYSVTKFKAGVYSQTTAKLTFGNPWTNISYENDYMFFFPGPDGGDRWRTAAVGMNFGPLSLNLNMFTGNPDVNALGDRHDYAAYMDNGKGYYTGNTANDPKLRAGVLSFGIGPIRVGRNSEQIRHVFQNRFAHDILTGGKSLWFIKLPISPSWYWYFGTGSGNTLW